MSNNTTVMITDAQNFFEFVELELNDWLHNLIFRDEELTEKEKYSFFYSVLYCLTTHSFYMKHFLSLDPTNEDIKLFHAMMVDIYKDIKDNNFSSSIKSIKDYRKSIDESGIIKDPRILLMKILIKAFNKKSIHNSLKSSDKSGDKSAGLGDSNESMIKELENFLSNSSVKLLSLLSSSCDISFEEVYRWETEPIKDKNETENKHVVIQAVPYDNIKDKKIKKFRYSNFIEFNLGNKEVDTFTLSVCLKNYLKDIKRADQPDIKGLSDSDKLVELKKVFYMLPEILVIIISYGNDKDENLEKCHYDFDEILNFDKAEYNGLLGPEIKYKKYFLSELIVCKFPKKYNEFYYTYSRRDKSDKFNIYNSKEKKVRKGLEVKKILKKMNDTSLGGTTSYPFVLVYNAIK